jgi:hypothetical protein
MYGRGGAGMVEIVGPDGRIAVETNGSSCGAGPGCNDKLEW